MPEEGSSPEWRARSEEVARELGCPPSAARDLRSLAIYMGDRAYYYELPLEHFEDEAAALIRLRARSTRARAFEADLELPFARTDPAGKNGGSGPPPPHGSVAADQPIPQPVPRTPVVSRTRRWGLKVKAYAKARENEWGEAHRKYLLWVLPRFPRDIWRRVGVSPPPASPKRVKAAHVRALRDSPEWAPKTRSLYLQALRGLLRWARCPLADTRGLWALDGTPLNRRWLTKGQLLAVWAACSDPLDRLVVAAAGFNGLRRIEVLRLRVRDLSLTLPGPEVRVWGKGRNGGKYRTIPVEPRCYAALVEAAHDSRPEDRVFPFSRSVFDARLARLGRAAGLPFRLAGHTLRRTFGQIAFDAGVPIPTIQAIYGHASPSQTTEYIGIEGTRMAEGIARFERFLSAEG